MMEIDYIFGQPSGHRALFFLLMKFDDQNRQRWYRPSPRLRAGEVCPDHVEDLMMFGKSMFFALLVLAVAASAPAVETLDVKATVNGPWTTYGLNVTEGASNSIRAPLAARDGSLWYREG